MKNIFLDSDVILDMLMKREPYYIFSMAIFEMAKKGLVELCASSSCFTDIFYILRKSAGSEKAKNAIKTLSLYVKILAVDGIIIKSAIESDFSDFEDAVQYFTAKNNNIKYIITRNTKDYKISDISVITPEVFIKLI